MNIVAFNWEDLIILFAFRSVQKDQYFIAGYILHSKLFLLRKQRKTFSDLYSFIKFIGMYFPLFNSSQCVQAIDGSHAVNRLHGHAKSFGPLRGILLKQCLPFGIVRSLWLRKYSVLKRITQNWQMITLITRLFSTSQTALYVSTFPVLKIAKNTMLDMHLLELTERTDLQLLKSTMQ